MNKKNIIFGFSLLVVFALLFFFFYQKSQGLLSNKVSDNQRQVAKDNQNTQNFILSGFPLNEVPLYKPQEVNSNLIFVNTDPRNTSAFDDHNFAYYNLVYDTTATQEEFLNYYKGLFKSQIVPEYPNPNTVKGIIGQYKVSATHYGDDSTTGYLQVHLPDYQDTNIKNYFVDYPDIFSPNELLVEHEKSYGLRNQSGGEIEYTKYFTVIDSGDQDNDGVDDQDEFQILEEKYKTDYQDKPDYSFDQTNKEISWTQEYYRVFLTVSKSHSRVYLMLRKNLTQ